MHIQVLVGFALAALVMLNFQRVRYYQWAQQLLVWDWGQPPLFDIFGQAHIILLVIKSNMFYIIPS